MPVQQSVERPEGGLGNVPTGVPGFDLATGGGVPSGSLVILLGEAGAGHLEFAYTSARGLHRLMTGDHDLPGDGLRLPERVCYVSVARSREDISEELSRLFSPSPETSRFLQDLVFRDLSGIYFAGSNAPVSWTADERPRTLASLKRSGRSLNLLEELVLTLNQHGPGALVILDSLTFLAHYHTGERWRDLLFFVEGLQRAAKAWGGLVLAPLNAGTLDPRHEEDLLAIADGALRFRWEETPDRSRQRVMHVQAFRGLLPRLARDHIPKFEVAATPGTGLELAHVRLVSGRR